MGLLVDGVWQDRLQDARDGHFVRPATRYRNWVTPDGDAGPSGEGGFPAQRGRYHLYVALACPWAHRTVIFRRLKQLEDVIAMSVVEPIQGQRGWRFGSAAQASSDGQTLDSATADHVNGKPDLADVYLVADPRFTGRVTVPVLWDKERRTIVSNESAEIIRMFNSAFNAFTPDRVDYCPEPLRGDIDDINARVYEHVNNGVYRCGFALTQEAYEAAFHILFAELDALDQRLSHQRYLVGTQMTEADWRLFTTLIRFDAVYYSHFKCNLHRIADYPTLSNYLRDLYQQPGVAGTVNMDHIKRHYYGSMPHINPRGIVPLGPAQDFWAPHDRGKFV